MALKNIITQSGLKDINFQANELAENLSAHANGSLSKAHGINFAEGSDPKYYDSGGNILGDYNIRFVINDVIYYAPGKATSESGNPATSIKVDTRSDAEKAVVVTDSAWTTEFTSDFVDALKATNSELLIPHTEETHGETHRGLSVLSKVTSDNAGNTVGTHVILIPVNGFLYEIPCTTVFGGPPRAISGVSLTPSQAWIEIGQDTDDDSQTCSNRQLAEFTLNMGVGEAPITYMLQVKHPDMSVWQNVSSNPSYGPQLFSLDTPSGTNTICIQRLSAGTLVRIRDRHVENSWKTVCQVRFQCTNAVGTVFTNVSVFHLKDVDD